MYDIISPFCLAIREITIYTGNFSVPFLKESICSFFLDKLHLQLFVDRRQIRQVREMLAPQQKHKLHAPSLWYPARMLLKPGINQPTWLEWKPRQRIWVLYSSQIHCSQGGWTTTQSGICTDAMCFFTSHLKATNFLHNNKSQMSENHKRNGCMRIGQTIAFILKWPKVQALNPL